MKVREVFHVDVKQARSCGPNRPDDVRSSPSGMADVNATSHARVHVANRSEHIEWGREDFVFGTVVVDGDANVVLLDEFFDTRQAFGRRVSGDDDANAGAFAVFKLGLDVG